MGWVPCVLNLSIDKGDMVLYFRIVSTYMHRESKSVATVHTLTNFIISQVHWLKFSGSSHSWKQIVSGLVKPI